MTALLAVRVAVAVSIAGELELRGYGICGADAVSVAGGAGADGVVWAPANYVSQYNTLGMIDTYAANDNLNFNNTFLADSFSSPDGGCSDLWTSMVLRLAQNYGGEAFIQALFKKALKRPAAVITQDAIDNFVLAASAAAGVNLTNVFQNQWNWPVSTDAATEARNRFGLPV